MSSGVLIATIVGLSAIQSIFGVGILVFGTPLLLLAGLPFEQVLLSLLPSSLMISTLQIIRGQHRDAIDWKPVALIMPGVLLGTTAVLWLGHRLEIRPVVGGILLASAVLRASRATRLALQSRIRRSFTGCLVALGFIHGLSNLGGGLLTVVMGAAHDRKADVRRQVAGAYGAMAAAQLATVLATAPPVSAPLAVATMVLLPLIAALTLLVVGERLFAASGDQLYQQGLTSLLITFGLLLLFQS
jgi:uncharacterized membrane protein YfcA